MNSEEVKVYKKLTSKFTKELNGKEYKIHKNQDPNQYPYIGFIINEQPEEQKNGNPIYRIPLRFIVGPTESPINVELQIKSLTHMFWGELEHMLFYKNYTYTINSRFYSGMMDSINRLLKNIDLQLLHMKEQLSPKNKQNQVREVKEMITKLMYEKIHPDVKKILETEIDLREVYTVISQLSFLDCNSFEDTLKRANECFDRISTIRLDNNSFNLNQHEISTADFSCNEIYMKLIEKVDKLSKEEDLFWNSFLSIYISLYGVSYKNALQDISTKLIDQIKNKFSTEMAPQIRVLLNNTIISSVITSFCNYEKLDYFIEDIHQVNITNRIINSVRYHGFCLEKIDIKKDEKIIESIMGLIIKIQIDYYLFSELDTADLKSLIEFINQDSLWNPWIKYESIIDIIDGKLSIKNEEHLVDILHHYDEEGDKL